MDIEKLKAKKSNANLNTEDLFGLKKKNDAVKRFREVFGDFKERGLNEDTIIEAFAQSLCDFPVGFIEDISQKELNTAEMRIQTARHKLHDIFMKIKRKSEKAN